MTSSYSTWDDVATVVKGIVSQARLLKDKHTNETGPPSATRASSPRMIKNTRHWSKLSAASATWPTTMRADPYTSVPGLETDARVSCVSLRSASPTQLTPIAATRTSPRRTTTSLKRDYLDQPGLQADTS